MLLDYINLFFVDYIYDYISLSHLYFLFLYYCHIILSIWARAAGPRVRPDGMVRATWKQYIINLIAMCALMVLLALIF